MKRLSLSKILLLSLIIGLFTGWFGGSSIRSCADVVAEIVIDLLKLISLPIIFLSLLSSISGMNGLQEMRGLGRRVIQYTLGTTLIAAFIAFALFLIFQPVPLCTDAYHVASPTESPSYIAFLRTLVPSNFVKVFLDNNIVGVMVISILLSVAILTLPNKERKILNRVFSSLFAAVLRVTDFITYIMPLGVWAFVTLFVIDLQENCGYVSNIFWYVLCVVLANLIQGIIILPIFLKIKGVSPLKAFKGMSSALAFAFFSKSSSASLPVALQSIQGKLHVSKRVSNFSMPLCTTINMNACAAFIFLTVLFVAMSNGMSFGIWDMVLWVFIATIAAVGNAGVPMGCYFLSSAFLAALGVPLELLGIILPIYGIIDMLETALNVWSDSCITIVVDKELKAESQIEAT